jgi:NADH:ubiquinone oxidoreductase subunit 5 (subunit L)/multisubunit Na+/H+ antiporter MnhA subunit
VFHMINHAMYKSTLFLTGGAVEKQAGTTDLTKLGGLARKMPWTFICFFIAAAAISGVPPFNGFFSKELVYDGALERHWIFYAAAVLGSVLTAASFLKLGHAAYLGPLAKENENVKEAPFFMVLPMVVIAGLCIFFGVYNKFPLERLIQPIFGEHVLEGRSFAGWPHNPWLVIGTLIALSIALLNHLYGVRRTGKGIGAVDHIHHAPVLSFMYEKAERRWFDPYDLALYAVNGLARVLYWIDRFNDWVYNVFTVRLVALSNRFIRGMHDGKFGTYLLWSLLGLVVIVAYILKKAHTG